MGKIAIKCYLKQTQRDDAEKNSQTKNLEKNLPENKLHSSEM